MKILRTRVFLYLLILFVGSGCANIIPPSGGKKDIAAPKLLAVTPPDSQLNVRTSKIELRFDEYVQVAEVAANVQVAPLFKFPVNITAIGRRILVDFPDSLLQDNTTYRISFGNAIKDLHEGNPFSGYTYTFSTGGYFDSLRLDGTIVNAATGLPDTGVAVILYDATASDSAVVREKPMYITRPGPAGYFSFKGLPGKPFRIYALKDRNNNLTYDGGDESIAFIDSIVTPVDTFTSPIALRVFKEVVPDTAKPDSTMLALGKRIQGRINRTSENFVYSVGVDTADVRKRTFDITKPLSITFSKEVDSINKDRVNLVYDSAEISIEVPFTLDFDTAHEELLLLNTKWKEDAVYTLRLLKGFAKDSALTDAMPSRHTFRTKNDDDYGKLHIHLPSKYAKGYVLMVSNETDTIYMKPVTDTMVHLYKLRPAGYSIRVIKDSNGNGKWDTGDLFGKLQPEMVIPYSTVMQLKAGWENTIDFEPRPPAKEKPDSPQKRDKP